ncbi:MAG: hypothetical protein LC641_07945 [Spirochaeta sp.]|nr:hypothetical protein [Spirochaeta sp.]
MKMSREVAKHALTLNELERHFYVRQYKLLVARSFVDIAVLCHELRAAERFAVVVGGVENHRDI